MKKLLFGAIVSTFLLTGCSNVTNSKELKMGEVFNSGKEHISYVIDYDEDSTENVDKDSYIDYVIVSKKGETKIYDMEESEITLGKVAKMSDDEIKEKALKIDKKTFNADKNDHLSYLDSRLNDYLTHNSEKGDIKAEKQKVEKVKYKEPEFKKMTIKVYTDGSGNETSSESFSFDEGNIQRVYKATNSYSSDDSRYKIPVSVPIYPFDIYDKRYAGLKSVKENAYIITEVGDKVETPMLDSQDDKYVDEVD